MAAAQQQQQQQKKHSDLTAEIQGKRLSVQQAISRIAHERDKDLTDFDIPCENPACGKLVPVQESWSPVFWLAFAGHRDVTGFQMNEANGTFPHQHFYCSEPCMEAGVVACFREHYHPEAKARQPQPAPAAATE